MKPSTKWIHNAPSYTHYKRTVTRLDIFKISITDMTPSTIAGKAERLLRLLEEKPKRRMSEAAALVADQRGVLRRAIRKGHSLKAIAAAVGIPERTLQKHLSKAGLFFRKPRKNKGRVIRPYKSRKKGTGKRLTSRV